MWSGYFIKVNSLFRKTNCLLGTLDKGCTLFFIKEFRPQIEHPSGSRLLSFGLLKVEAPCLLLFGWLFKELLTSWPQSWETCSCIHFSNRGRSKLRKWQLHYYAEMGIFFSFYRNDRISGMRSTDFSGLYLNLGVVVRLIGYQVVYNFKLFNGKKCIAGILLLL